MEPDELTRIPVNAMLTFMNETYGAHSLSAAIVDIAAQLAGQLASPGTDARVAAISLILTLDRMTDRALHAVVQEARAADVSWQQIGDITGTSRQGAAQRFGNAPSAIDDLTIKPLTNAVPLAASLFAAFFADDRETFRPHMSKSVAAALTNRRLTVIQRQLAKLLGALEAIDSPAAEISMLGDMTLVRTPLRFSGGTATGEVSFTPDARMLGFRIYPAVGPTNGESTDG